MFGILSIGGYLASIFRMATPILYASLGLLLLNNAGLRLIGCEGVMLMGSLVAVVGSYSFGNVWIGLLFAMVAGAVMGLIYAALTVSLRANQTVIGVAYNLLSGGLTAFLSRIIFRGTQTPKIDTFTPLKIPFVSKIPIVGEAFFTHQLLVYIAFAIVPVVSYFLYRTPTGLNLRSTGENPEAADTLGVDVYKIRYSATMVGCMLMAIGGAFLSTGLLRFFTEDMVAGRGFIAVAAVVFGKYRPRGTLLATLIFSAGSVVAHIFQAFGSTLSAGISYNLPVMIPYLLTIIVLTFTGKTNPPSALGEPYKKG